MNVIIGLLRISTVGVRPRPGLAHLSDCRRRRVRKASRRTGRGDPTGSSWQVRLASYYITNDKKQGICHTIFIFAQLYYRHYEKNGCKQRVCIVQEI